MYTQTKKILATTAAVVFMTLASVAHAAGAVGTWELGIDAQGQLITATLTVTEEGGALSAELASPLGDYTGEDVAFEDGVLTFTVDIEDQGVVLDYEGTIDGDSIDGVLLSADIGEISASGTRVGGSVSAAGTYNLMVESQLGNNARKLVINDDLSGTYGGGDFDDFSISNVKLDGDTLTLDVTLDVQGQDLPSSLTLTLDGDAVSGELDYGQGTAAIEGKRAASVSIVGTWMMSGVSDDTGDLERSWMFNDDMTGSYEGDIGTFDITEVSIDGSNVTFKVVLEVQGQELPSTFTGKLEGNSLAGDLNYGAGNASFEGTKK